MSPGHYARHRIDARLRRIPLSGAYRIAALRPHPDWLTRRLLEPFALRSVPSRFCDGESGYAVLYAAAEFHTAFLETLVRDRFVQRQQRHIPFTDVTSRGWIQYETAESSLILLDIRDTGCVEIGAPTDVMRARHQGAGRAFARAIFAEHADVDGLLYPSRLNGQDCYAVFDRALTKLRVVDQGELKHHPAISAMLERYDIRLLE